MSQPKIRNSSEAVKILAEQRQEIADNKKYLSEQQEIIDRAVEAGQNQIHALASEVDELQMLLVQARNQLIDVSNQIDTKRFELLGL